MFPLKRQAIRVSVTIGGLLLCISGANAKSNTKAPNRAQLDCGEAYVEVETHCLPHGWDGSAGHCKSQKLTIKTRSRTIRQTLLYPDTPGIQSLVVGISCLSDDKTTVIEFSSTDFANCGVCEWSDFYSTSGIYLGSTREKFGATNFKYREISTSRREEFRNLPQKSSVEIHR